MIVKKILLPAFFLATLFSTNIVKADFPDVLQTSEYYQSINTLQDLGVVQGYQNGEFDMNREVSRGEFLKMIYETEFGGEPLPNLKTSCFPDLKLDDWDTPYICWAKSNGYVKGYPDGKFYPDQTVKMVEAAKILTLAKEGTKAYYLNDDLYAYHDKEHWANRYFNKLAPYFIPPSINNADQLLTRAETAEIIWRRFLATKEELQEKPSKILAWDGDHYMALIYLGSTNQDDFDYFYAADENKVYSLPSVRNPFEPTELLGADPKTFTVKEYYNNSAKKFVGVDENGLYDAGKKVPESKGGFFEFYLEPKPGMLSGYTPYSYMFGRDKENVYLITCHNGCRLDKKLPTADPETFETLGDGYGKDGTSAYIKSVKIENADGATFQRFSAGSTNKLCSSIFSRDKDSLFISTKKIVGADPNTFEFLGKEEGFYFKDKNQVYRIKKTGGCWEDQVYTLQEANLADFKSFSSSYFSSNGHIYYIDNETGKAYQTEAEMNTFVGFETLPNNEYSSQLEDFGKDSSYVYFKGHRLESVDVQTFKFETEGVFNWIDKNKVYEIKDFNKMIGI